MRILLVAFLLFACSCAFAQQHRFADSTAEWSVLEYNTGWVGAGSISTIHYHIAGDTVLLGTPYQVINYSWPIHPLENNGKFYIRKDSTEKVYGRINADSADYLLYDFGSVAGDTFIIQSPDAWSYPLKITIDSVSYIMYGHLRKALYVSMQNDIAFGYNDIFVEGIGSFNNFFLYPGASFIAFDLPTYNLLCFSEFDTLAYRNTQYTTCDYDTSWTWNSIDELASVGVKISPNPTTDVVQVQLQNTNVRAVFELTDLTGRSVLQQQLNEPVANIPVGNLSKGVYMYTIRNSQQRLSSGKLVVE
ncbi:MAG TPA: T9SS type A sorting domain-containing protein [Chitinophagales bacterium]|nr:T9SS type A sorting domain-containing protein [Chitinophagales bacterium]